MKKELLMMLLAASVGSFMLVGCHVGTHGPHGGVMVSSPPPYANSAPAPVVTPGPPPHAKAYGYRDRYHYYYYPDVSVYFDVGRSVYFYLQNGSWTMSASLPAHWHVSLGDHVSLEMEIDRPYLGYDDHRKKYPGQHEKKKKKKGKRDKKDGRDDREDRDD